MSHRNKSPEGIEDEKCVNISFLVKFLGKDEVQIWVSWVFFGLRMM